jgi:hypothetical protein
MRPLFFDSITAHGSASLSDFDAPINPVSVCQSARRARQSAGKVGRNAMD